MGAVISTVQSVTSTISAGLKTLASLHSEFSSLLTRAASAPGFPVPEPTQSYWLDDPPFPALCDIQDDDLPQEADVVIIGSGIAGASVAKSLLELSESKLRVVVCEARQLCSGATGRNGGHIKSAPYEDVTQNSDASYTVKTSRGVIRTQHVVHTTNAYAGQLVPSLRGSLAGALAHMSAQRPGASFPSSHGNRSWSVVYAPGFDYVTQRPDGPDGTPGDLMIGGGFFRSRREGLDQIGVWDDSQTHALPLMHIRGVMPTVFEPQWGEGSKLIKSWTGILGFTGDLMPLVGRVPGSRVQKDSGEWMAAGFCGEGMVWAWLCGTALAVMVLGKEGEDLAEGVGRPGGKLNEWFPKHLLTVDKKRLRKAEIANLADFFE
ncbi:FAD dependent oxidoreductase-domain-containing protein [Fusarium acuminatum]|uniref:FAD dependent oxidoreductase-domain-containing protein n=1 Tax=Fusarium acuminatum TaxID=5515 RepID=A0ABZ2WGT9_9HYPO